MAVLGSGIMGAPMARNLAGAGWKVRAWNRTREKADPLAEHGVTVCDTPAEAVSGAGIALTMLSDGDAVEEAARAMLDALEDGAVWILASGPSEERARCGPVFDAIGRDEDMAAVVTAAEGR